MPRTVNVYEAKTHLSSLLARVEAGEEITLSRNGRPVARIVPLANEQIVRKPGAWRGKITVNDDFDEFSDADARDWYSA